MRIDGAVAAADYFGRHPLELIAGLPREAADLAEEFARLPRDQQPRAARLCRAIFGALAAEPGE
jgi:hypothetical protein